MTHHRNEKNVFSRRSLLRRATWAPVLFLPAPFHTAVFRGMLGVSGEDRVPLFPFADFRFRPHYPAQNPLDEVLRLAAPGTDEYIEEKYALEIFRILQEWGEALKRAQAAHLILAKSLHASLEATELTTVREKSVRSGGGVEVRRRE